MKQVLIYNDVGVSGNSFQHTLYTFSELLGSRYIVRGLSSNELLKAEWIKTCALLIFPGGRDVPYMDKLKGLGNHLIRSYVEEGGQFLGICAGAYYGGGRVEFAIDTDLEISEKRELQFFPGSVHGPLLASYDYKTLRDARAAKIHWDAPLHLYYHGGGYFAKPQDAENTTVLANYDDENRQAAIVKCNVGAGTAVLSGVHFEYSPALLDPNNQYLKEIIPKLHASNGNRLKLINHVLTVLRV